MDDTSPRVSQLEDIGDEWAADLMLYTIAIALDLPAPYCVFALSAYYAPVLQVVYNMPVCTFCHVRREMPFFGWAISTVMCMGK